jgi:hypothetical protein
MTANCEMNTKNLIDTYEKIWNENVGGSQNISFRTHVPTGEVDFTGAFTESGLSKVFTPPPGEDSKILTKMMGNYNCNYLFRDSQKECAVVVYSTENYTVLHPLGEPGRDLGDGHGFKVSHLMVVSHGSGPLVYNEFLPSTQEENNDLGNRIAVMNKAIQNLQRNVPLSQCGAKVVEKATKMSFPTNTGIRTFMAAQISSMSPEKRSGRPGYILKNSVNQDIADNPLLVTRQIDEVFSNKDVKPLMLIQPPNKSSQLLSHIHCFLMPACDLPAVIDENYVNVELVHLLKQDKITMKTVSESVHGGLSRQSSVRDASVQTPDMDRSASGAGGGGSSIMGGSLCRQLTSCGGGNSELTEPLSTVDEGAPLSRQASVRLPHIRPPGNGWNDDSGSGGGLARQASVRPAGDGLNDDSDSGGGLARQASVRPAGNGWNDDSDSGGGLARQQSTTA